MSTPEMITALLSRASYALAGQPSRKAGEDRKVHLALVDKLASALRHVSEELAIYTTGFDDGVYAGTREDWIARAQGAEAALQRAHEEQEQLLAALRKVRGHTSYVNPTMELLSGLLQSIERITDAALKDYLASRDEGKKDE